MDAFPDGVTLGELTERQILQAILSRIPPASGALLGPGDDAALLRISSGSVVVTTDTLVQGPDFRTEWSSGYDLGWKSAAVNLVDIAAMGARPTALAVAVAAPKSTSLAVITSFADGLRAACEGLAPGCSVIGGDLTTADQLVIAVTALGELDGTGPVTRSGADPGDYVALAGEIGLAAEGLRILFERFHSATSADVLDKAVLDAGELRAVEAQLRPIPPIGLGVVAARAGATAMIDVSDGLSLDAERIADASGVAIEFFGADLGSDPGRALGGGEDHALLATFRSATLPPGFRVIGRVVPRGESALLLDGEALDPVGWDPYRQDLPGSGSPHHSVVEP